MAEYVFCESRRQVERAFQLRRAGELGLDNVVAVLPDAAWALRQHGVVYHRLEDFYSEADLLVMAEPSLERLVAWAERVDDWLQGNVPDWPSVGFRPAALTGYFLKMFFDSLAIRAYIAAQFISDAKPTSLAFFGPPARERLEWNLGFNESVYALVLPGVTARYGVRSVILEPPRRDDFVRFEGFTGDYGVRVVLRAAWRRLPPGVRRLLRSVLERRSRASGDVAREGGAGRARLCLGQGYDLEGARAEALREGMPFADWPSLVAHATRGAEDALELTVAPQAAWALLKVQPFFWELAEPEGVDLRAVVAPRLDVWWSRGVLPMWREFAVARARLARAHITAILTPVVTTHRELATQAAARSVGIPVASFQHGGFQGYCEYPGLDVADLRIADAYFTYGQGVARYFEQRRKRVERSLAPSIAVGSARLDALVPPAPERRLRLRRRLAGSADRPIVLYVPTVFGGYGRQLNEDGYPDVPYFELQLRIFDLFRARPEVCLAYKGFVSAVRNPVRAALARSCPSARYVMSPRLTELVWAADAIVLDYPSTGLLEAAATSVPIVLYADRECLQIVPEARDPLARRVRLAETADDFVWAVKELLESRGWGPLAPVDRSFEELYATHRRDGRAAARTLRGLDDLARNATRGGAV